MNWGEFKTEIQRRLQDTNVSDLIPGWFNSASVLMDSLCEWRSLDRRKVIPTVAPYSTGTVTATNGSTSVTLSGGTFPTDCAGQLISFTSDGTYYDISSRTDALTIVLGSNYVGTTGASKAYTITNYAITPPTGFDPSRLYNIVFQDGGGSYHPLRYVTEIDTYDFFPDETETSGLPEEFRYYGGKVILSPAPDAAYNTLWLYKARPTIYTTATIDATTFDWSDEEVEVLLVWTWEIGLIFLANAMFQAVQGMRKEMVAAAIGRNNKTPGGLCKLQPVAMQRTRMSPLPARVVGDLG